MMRRALPRNIAGLRPPGDYFGVGKYMFRATGEFRPPLKGEWYLSGAIVEAYLAPNDLSTEYWIAVPVEVERRPCAACGGTGRAVREVPTKGVRS